MKVFLSYAHAAEVREAPDGRSALAVRDRLQLRGHEIYVDSGLVPGSDFAKELQRWVCECDVFLLFVSPEALGGTSGGAFCRTELDWALHRKPRPRIVPVLQTETSLKGSPVAGVHLLRTAGNFVAEVCDEVERPKLVRAPGPWVGVVVTVAGVLLAYAFLLYVLEQHTGGELTIVVKRGLAAIVLLLGAVAFVVGRFVRSRR